MTSSGLRCGGEKMATSLVAVSPEPVLSPSRQSDGKPAGNEFGAYLDFCVLRHSMSAKKDMYATQDDEESPGPSIGAAA